MMDAKEIAERVRYATTTLEECIDINPKRCGGKPTLKGTRFTVAQLLAELTDGESSLYSIAEDFNLDPNTLKAVLQGLSACLDYPS